MAYQTEKIIYTLSQDIKKIVETFYPNYSWEDFDFSLTQPPRKEMGDFSFACFNLAQRVGGKPEEIARVLAEKIKSSKFLERVNNVGPYLNLFLKRNIFFSFLLKDILRNGESYGKIKLGQEKIMVEYSSPNTNKPLHLGHLRNDVLGMAISNLLENRGYKVIRANLINDRGIHLGKVMVAYQMAKEKKWLRASKLLEQKIKGDHLVGNLYVFFEKKLNEEKKKFLKNKGIIWDKLTKTEKKEVELEFFKESKLYQKAQEMLDKWEKGDKKIRNLAKKINQLALSGLKETYQRTKTKFDKWYFESKIYQLGKKIIYQALKKGLCYKNEEGAIEIDLEKYNLGKKILVRKDGTSVYITQDIGLAKKKFDDYNLTKSIYIVANEQDYHFKLLFKILEILGYSFAKKCYHLSYGMVYLPEGKMKSREGKVVEADELLDKMHNLAKREILKREQKISSQELEKRAEKIGQAAIKFYLLNVSPSQDIFFLPEKSISFDGDSGPYLQYTFARIKSIFRKGKIKNSFFSSPIKKNKLNKISLKEEEWELTKLIYSFPEVVRKAADNYAPNLVTEYLLKLAACFNRFYQKYPVLKAPNQEEREIRLYLIKGVEIVLKRSFQLLNIDLCSKM